MIPGIRKRRPICGNRDRRSILSENQFAGARLIIEFKTSARGSCLLMNEHASFHLVELRPEFDAKIRSSKIPGGTIRNACVVIVAIEAESISNPAAGIGGSVLQHSVMSPCNVE